MASKLNADCLTEIFEILESDQVTTSRSCTLHSCILVNRQWCSLAIKILWKNPWNYRKNLECVAHTIINTFISTFSKESKEKLKENKIIIIPNEILTRETIFNYAKYLKNLNLFHLEITLESWFHYLLSSQRQLQRQQHQQHQQMDDDVTKISLRNYKFIFEELLINFFNQSTNILNLNVSACRDSSISSLTNSIEQSTRAMDCLANLRYFKCSGTMPKLYSLLSNISPNLIRIHIERYMITEELANLINVQNNLKEIGFHKHPSLRHPPLSLTNNIIGTSLINQSSSIETLIIKGIYFQSKNLSYFENLKELNIRICGGMRYTREELLPLALVSLNHLQTFFWYSTHYIYLDLFPNFFRNNGKNLKFITIKGFMISDPENAGILINSIANHCINLRSFSGPILRENILELTKMIENCKELQSLTLHPSRKKCYGPQKKECFDELMNVLINQQKNIRLSELTIVYSWKFSFLQFERLMKKFEEMQKKKFKFSFDPNILKDQNFKYIANKFIDLGILKEIIDFEFGQ
ncbi:hypothetical protein RhiirA4_443046 [Rhizophagus irregularis]|uniref:F-box domain-containing protein n=1 Tax=Rhizophagus irregularis TaxID=588596 RepID=A0A2I1GCF5_9GLOM|nr:hypothetical protein RhiirA4_443046 [Rhizophagus irregularis]